MLGVRIYEESMSTSPDHNAEGQPHLAQRVARLLRHEVGDLLQTVYSTTAILSERLPREADLERRLLGDLKHRAELCKLELDAVVEILNDQPRSRNPVDLALVFSNVVTQVKRRYPILFLRQSDSEANCLVWADAQALTTAFSFLLLTIAQSARSLLGVDLSRQKLQIICTLERDGYPLNQDQLSWLREPFATTQQALFGLALALIQRTIEPSGGTLEVFPRELGGLRIEVKFPVLEPCS